MIPAMVGCLCLTPNRANCPAVALLTAHSSVPDADDFIIQGGQLRRSQMKSSQLNKSRFIVGLILVAVAVLMLLFVKGDYSTTGAIGLGVLGLVSIAISRRK